MSLFSELKRRNVLRVAAAYVAVGWLLIQVVETLFPVFGLSDAAIRSVVVVLAIGFVPVVVVAWVFELTPEGFVRDSDVDRGSAAVKASARRLDRIAMVTLALAVGYFAFDKFMLDPARDEAIADAAREQGRAEALQASRDAGPPVLAVLPFAAVTDTEDSEFFAAGVHDDLLTKLAKLPSMLVISRTSVLEYRGTTQNIREIGAALGASAILEGGVQSAGNRIRINAQLIDAATDEHLWAETYDRDLTAESIFDVQDDIARSIAEALHLTLSTPAQEDLIPTSNMAAYRAFHEALNFSDSAHGARTTEEYRDMLRTAIELDPAFTRPRALLVGSYALAAFRRDAPDLVASAEAVMEEFRAVAPDSADYLVAQTYFTYYILEDYDLALKFVAQALERMPSDTHLIAMRSWIQRRQGDFVGRIETLRRARQLEPGDPTWTGVIAHNLLLIHQYDEALIEFDSLEVESSRPQPLRAWINLRDHGDIDRLVEEMESIAAELSPEEGPIELAAARIAARDYAGAEALLDDLDNQPVSLYWGISARPAISLITYWLQGNKQKLSGLAAETQRQLEEVGTRDDMMNEHSILSWALLAAVAGDAAETERLADAWESNHGQDLASRSQNWNLLCQVLGIGGAAEAAVECIRTGLEEPSYVMPFVEPHLPYYDSIRDEPVFQALIEELGN